MKERITLELPPNLKFLRLAALAGAQTAQSIFSPDNSENNKEFIHAFELALSETFTNAVKHRGKTARPGPILIELTIEKTELSVTVKDRNPHFDMDGMPSPKIADHPDSGYGLFILKQLMDTVVYRRDNGWNMITMTKKVKPESTT